MPDDSFSRAAKKHAGNAGAAMSPQYDQIGFPLHGRFDDLLAGTAFLEIFPKWGIPSNAKGSSLQELPTLLTEVIKKNRGRETSLRRTRQLGVNDMNQGNLRTQCFRQIRSDIHRALGNGTLINCNNNALKTHSVSRLRSYVVKASDMWGNFPLFLSTA
jgi:hypothetical protein